MQRPEHENLHAIGSIIRSAYMSTRHVKSSPAPFSFLSFFLPPFLLFDRAAGFLPPRPPYCRGPARTDAVKAGRFFSGHPSGPRPLQQSSTTADLMGRGRLHSCCYLSVSRVSAHYSDDGCCLFFGRPCYEVHDACDNHINLYPAAPIRLAKVLLAWTIAQEGWGSSFERQIGKCQFAMRTHSHTSDLPDTPDWGCRNSAHCRCYRVRVAPCGTSTCSR